MLTEIRTIKGHSQQVIIYRLVNNGKLKKHINDRGYVCYDSRELEKYVKTKRRGRPAKTLK